MNRSRTHAAKEPTVRHFNSLGKKVFTKERVRKVDAVLVALEEGLSLVAAGGDVIHPVRASIEERGGCKAG